MKYILAILFSLIINPVFAQFLEPSGGGGSTSVISGSTSCTGCTSGNLLGSSGSPATVSDAGIAASLLSQMPAFTTLCNATGITAVVQDCPAVTAVAPLSISAGGSPQLSFSFGVGTANTFLNNAGNALTSGLGNNIGIGQFSLLSVTTGFRNVSISPAAFQNLTTGNSNICIGFQCGSNLIGGSNNVGLSVNGFINSTNAAFDLAIGTGSLTSLTSGQSNVGVGGNSCASVTTGSTNTCIGQGAAPTTMVTTSAVTLASSTTITLNGNDTANSLQTGMLVTGTSIPAGTTVTGCPCTGTTFTISNAATATGTGSVLTFTASSDPNRYTVNSNAASSVGNANSTITLDGTAGTGTISGLHLLIGQIATDGGGKIPANAAITVLNGDNVTITINKTTGAGPTAEIVTFTNPNVGLGILTGSNNVIIGNCNGFVFNAGNQYGLCDGAGNLRADYGKTTVNRWSFFGATASTGGVTIADTLASSSKITGSLINQGGFGNAGAIFTDTLNVITMASSLNANVVCYNSGTGLLTFQVSATGCAASSARFKEALAPFSTGRALSTVLGLEPMSYRYKPEFEMGSDNHIGFTAEQVATIDPSLVTYEDDGVTPHAVKYGEMAPLFAGAIQRLKADNDNLHADNDNLRERLERLERRK